jgi:chemotaxis family two-component system response regulator Rcp1
LVRILLAEDNPGDILLVRRALDKHHIRHELHVLQDGAQALDFLAHMGQPGEVACPDVMLLDLNLPKVDGFQILVELRNHPKCAHTPVIVVTSSDAPEDRARMAELGIAGFFAKPIDLDAFMQLGAVVREVVDGQTRDHNSSLVHP